MENIVCPILNLQSVGLFHMVLEKLFHRIIVIILFLIILVTPGPGSYRIPSDFGYYESKNKDRL